MGFAQAAPVPSGYVYVGPSLLGVVALCQEMWSPGSPVGGVPEVEGGWGEAGVVRSLITATC